MNAPTRLDLVAAAHAKLLAAHEALDRFFAASSDLGTLLSERAFDDYFAEACSTFGERVEQYVREALGEPHGLKVKVEPFKRIVGVIDVAPGIYLAATCDGEEGEAERLDFEKATVEALRKAWAWALRACPGGGR